MSTKLPEGLTCGDCFHIRRCQFLIQQSPTEKRCDFDPSRFIYFDGDDEGIVYPMQAKSEEVEE